MHDSQLQDFLSLEQILNEKIYQHEKQQRKQKIQIYNEKGCNQLLNHRDLEQLTVDVLLREAKSGEISVPKSILQEILLLMK